MQVHELFQVCRICGKGVVFYNMVNTAYYTTNVSVSNTQSSIQSCKTCSNFLRVKFKVFNLPQNMAFSNSNIDGLHLTSRRPCWRYNTKEYAISSIVGSSQRGWLPLSSASREIDCKPRIYKFKTIQNL